MPPSTHRPRADGRRGQTLRAWGLGAAILFAAGCSLSPDVKSERGVPVCAAQRDAYVLGRAQPPVPRPVAPTPLTLRDLLGLVEEGSVEVQIVRAQVQAAAADVSLVRSDLLPNLAIGVDASSYARQPGSSVFKTDRSVTDAFVEIRVPLDVSSRLAESVRAAQARYRSAEQRLRATGREQRLLVAQAYFTLLAAQDLAKVNEAAVAVQERALKDGRARLAVGTVRRNDVLVIEVAVSNSRQRAVALEAAILNARRALNAATGLPIDHPTEVAEFDALIPVDGDVVPILDRARYDNPEVDVLVETRTALLHELESNERANWPEVSLGPRITGTTEAIAQPAENFLGFLSVSWNPDLSGRLVAERRGLRAQMIEAAWSLTGLLRSIEERILRAHQTAVERTSAFLAAETSVDQARENQRILLEQFAAGVASGREVLEAQALLSQQDGTLKVARHQVNGAQFDLWFLAGVDPIEYLERISGAAESRPASSESRPESR